MWTAIKQFFATPEPALPSSHAPLEGAHALDAVCAKFQATHSRAIVSDHNEVQITLIRADGTLSATGATTAEAVERIVVKAEKCWGAL
jgi:hypothetical protein